MNVSVFPRAARGLRPCVLAAVFSTFAVTPASAAPVDPANAACRAVIAKSVSKLANTTMKAFDGCIQAGLKGDSVDCTSIATADLKQKVPRAQSQLDDKIAAACDDTTHAVALAELERCGPPNGSHISGFAGLPGCFNDMIPQNIESLRNFVLQPDFGTTSSPISKCIKSIAKNSTKVFKAVQKVKHKAIKELDSLGGDSGFVDPGDPDFKIDDAVSKAILSIFDSCLDLTTVEWTAVNSCDNDPLITGLCAIQNVLSAAEGVAAAAYDLPGICPSGIDVVVLDGSEGGILKRETDLDVGWTGNGHQVDTNEFFTIGLDTNCGSATDNDCSSCTVSVNCESGNCRCRNDAYIFCDEPFGTDTDCSGNMCDYLLGPALPTPTGGTPICTMQRVESLTGTAGFDTGAVTLTANVRRFVHIGPTHAKPCPTCDFDTGLCVGGERDGLLCDIDTVSEFGDVSYDCPPALVANLSGTGIASEIDLSTSPDTFTATLPCDAPLAGEDCHCSACSGDTSLACSSDSVCLSAGAGVCGTSVAQHLGYARRPNACSDLTCTPVVGRPGEGECVADEDMWCDGIVKGNNEGVVSCATQLDCDNIPGAGNCSQSLRRRCFLNPISEDGSGGPVSGVDNGVLSGAYCMPTSSNGGVNGAYGLPGPARMTLAGEFYSICGGMLWSPGGAHCQP